MCLCEYKDACVSLGVAGVSVCPGQPCLLLPEPRGSPCPGRQPWRAWAGGGPPSSGRLGSEGGMSDLVPPPCPRPHPFCLTRSLCVSPGGAEAGRGGPWVGAGAGRRAPAPCGQLSVRRGPAPHLGQSWLRLLGTTAEAYRPGWAALTWMRSWARTVRRAPSHRHMWTPAQAPWVPVGWGPCPQGQAVCSQRLLQPPQGRGIQRGSGHGHQERTPQTQFIC